MLVKINLKEQGDIDLLSIHPIIGPIKDLLVELLNLELKLAETGSKEKVEITTLKNDYLNAYLPLDLFIYDGARSEIWDLQKLLFFVRWGKEDDRFLTSSAGMTVPATYHTQAMELLDFSKTRKFSNFPSAQDIINLGQVMIEALDKKLESTYGKAQNN